MKEYTKTLHEEYEKDFRRISRKNEKRTPEQNNQSAADKKRYYTSKWEALYKRSTTSTQKNICRSMIQKINRINENEGGIGG